MTTRARNDITSYIKKMAFAQAKAQSPFPTLHDNEPMSRRECWKNWSINLLGVCQHGYMALRAIHILHFLEKIVARIDEIIKCAFWMVGCIIPEAQKRVGGETENASFSA